MFSLHTVKDTAECSISVIDSKPLVMELDTVAAYSIISNEIWKKLFPNLMLEDGDLPLPGYVSSLATGRTKLLLVIALIR